MAGQVVADGRLWPLETDREIERVREEREKEKIEERGERERSRRERSSRGEGS